LIRWIELSVREHIDCLVVGAGFAGVVMAERLSNAVGKRCVVIDQREHIAGNAHDFVDDAGVLVHAYGPHYFRTNSEMVRDYLSRFTTWHPVDYQIKSYADGQFWSFPINLNTYEEMVGRPATEEEFKSYLEKVRVPIADPANSEEVIISQVGKELYERFFEGYTLKQWKRHPRELDASVCGRIPIRTNRDDRYLREEFQALPADGYTKLFERMLDESPKVEVKLGTSLAEASKRYSWDMLVFTGAIDQYFDECCGPLPYRSLKFERESFTAQQLVEEGREKIAGKTGFWQPAMQVNYPGKEVDFTRIVEIKHATGQVVSGTSISREFPAEVEETYEPYYPVPTPESAEIYRRYKRLADAEKSTVFLGRLATYRYYNMDQVVAMALRKFEQLGIGE